MLPIRAVFYFLLFRAPLAVGADSSICQYRDTSCSSQLSRDLDEGACLVKYFEKSGDERCNAMVFRHQDAGNYPQQHLNKNLGRVRLKAILDEEYRRTIMGLEFSSIKWKSLKMRFRGANIDKKMCRILTIRANYTAQSDAVLKYYCPWYDNEMVSFAFTYEYEMSSGDQYDVRKFAFKIPSYDEIFFKNPSEANLFTYVDETDTQMLRLWVQALPVEFKVSEYKIEVFRRRDMATKVDVRIVKIDDDEEEFSFDYNTYNEHGYYYFHVTPLCSDEKICGGASTSATIFIDRKHSRLAVGMVGAFTIITLFLYFAYARGRPHRLYGVGGRRRNNEIRVLLIYTPSTKRHVDVAARLAGVLEKTLKMTALLDVNGIPKTPGQDPLKWCTDAFSTATHIVCLASPKSFANESIYRVDNVLMRFLREELSKPVSQQRKIALVTFPYAKEDAPPELRHFPAFNLPKDFSQFERFLTSRRHWLAFLTRKRSPEDDPDFAELVNAVAAATEAPEIVKIPERFSRPEIKVTMDDDGNDETKESDSLVAPKANDNKYSFRIDDLNLSGQKGREGGEQKPDSCDDPEKVFFKIENLAL